MLKSKHKTPISIMILVGLLTTGCPPQKGEIVCALTTTKSEKQTYVTGVESGRGEIYTIGLEFDCIDSLKIDSVKLRGKNETFEAFRNGKKIKSFYPRDSIQVVINHFELAHQKHTNLKENPKIQIFYSSRKYYNFLMIDQFSKGKPIMNR